MNTPELPDPIRALADARQAARDARDFAKADRLRAEIEEAGWAIVDQAHSYRLHRAHSADVVDSAGRMRYGWSGAVPSRLDEPAMSVASLVLVAPDDADTFERTLAALAGAVADEVQRVVVANDLAPEAATLLTRLADQWAAEGDSLTEVVWLAERAGAAASLNAGIRRAAGPIVVLLGGEIEALGDFVGPLSEALGNPSVAVAGPWGLTSDDMRRFEPASVADVGPGDVTAISLDAMAFRRSDYAGRGPLDERFVEPPLLDAWWSLVLRDPEGDEMTPRRAVLVDAPLVRPAMTGAPASWSAAAADERVVRRNRYRIIDTFGGRRDLAVPGK